MEEYKKSLVEDHWSKVDCSASEKNFYCFPPIRSHSCKLIFDENDARREDWCEYWTIEKYFKDKLPFEKCLSICCGFGKVERTLSRLHFAKKIVGTDIAPGAIEQAKARAQAEQLTNIEYFIADLNEEKLPEKEYDVIWANGALHHIRQLDIVVPKLKNALKDGGFLISNEYVGPNYQQIGTRQKEIINAAKHLLPIELVQKDAVRGQCPRSKSIIAKAKQYLQRKDDQHKCNDPIYEKIWEGPTPDFFLQKDPSECVNSEEIIPTLQKHFDHVEVKYFDGSLLMYALDSKFYNAYNSNNPKHRKFLNLLFHIEETLIEIGELPRDNAHIICKKNNGLLE
jgi:2-polyprenyl-3-methyl-5-hydroxy-6-metoxy-1,4-benzoquinol methylase